MNQALARAWSRITLLERFIAIALITLWVIGTVYVLTRIADVAIVAGEVFFLPYVLVTVLVVIWLFWMLVRGRGRRAG